MKKFSWAESQNQTAFPIAKAGCPFMFGSAFITAVFALLGIASLSLIFLLITFCIAMFFRDPDRVIPSDENAVISPADGKVIFAEKINDQRFYGGECKKISIFMSVFNVHVNRIPYSGNVTRIQYYPGKFFSANLDKASAENEHNAVFLETENGEKICFVQIAGLVARRIISKLQENDKVISGSRFGLICFGSRLDVYLPADTKLKIKVGDKVAAGTSILGYLK